MTMLGTADLGLLERLLSPLGEIPFFVKDRDLRFVAANPAMASLVGVRHPSELIGHTSRDFFTAHVAEMYEAVDRHILQSGDTVRDRLELTGPRSDTWLLYTRTPVFAGDGAVTGVAAVARALPAGHARGAIYSRLADALNWLRDHIAEPLDVPALAKRAGISVSQLERNAASVLGISLRTAQHRLRIDHAIGLLATGMPIAHIAQACGFSDQSAFTRRFRTATGLTPQRWRQRPPASHHAAREEAP